MEKVLCSGAPGGKQCKRKPVLKGQCRRCYNREAAKASRRRRGMKERPDLGARPQRLQFEVRAEQYDRLCEMVPERERSEFLRAGLDTLLTLRVACAPKEG